MGKYRTRSQTLCAAGVSNCFEPTPLCQKNRSLLFITNSYYQLVLYAADILNRIAKALDVTTDNLLNGTMQDKSADAITYEELLSQFRKVEQLPANKKKLVLKSFLMLLSSKVTCKNSYRTNRLVFL
ncbi:MAG: hypothetical protein IM474_12615 [Microcystis sp. M135S2]|jgi:energy-converting hydrogenase A subunit M|uniref:hypothetical protein n=1 Tax=Microcystis sp. M135S2 TaxID=2771144 RepID=UPI00258B3F64|nr:hypothetical protein [Microcystis sp. M135S2]MCA2776070.1 hypothetical protein [Microcystis sp. M135S2]